MSNLKTAGLLLGLLAAVSAGANEVKDDHGAPQLTVQFRASQLQTDHGVRLLYGQLLSAAERVCPSPTGVLVPDAIAACRRQAVAGAVAQINNARLAALSDQALKHG